MGSLELGQAIKRARERAGLSSTEVSIRIGVASGVLSNLEAGKQGWSGHLTKLADVLDADLLEWAVLAELLPPSVMERRGGMPEFAPGDARREVSERVARLTPERAEALRDIVVYLEREQERERPPSGERVDQLG